ncbi:TfoX/Sxy family protein [Brevibacterium sediminis]|uniref:TfoX/Sxy family protein n=1 Tax=Brevibacterium sediminis TaxID=1857024 RepID=A0A5C4X210_9MICO|nr:TfoX/Sxy family protein [Brevibacterium sediminis]TNM55262.1 TfoX/Sxy family protein [Brevibacterium sediminis]
MTPEQTSLIERIRALIAEEPVVREVSMFGGRAVMVNEKMIVSAGKTGDLLARVDADRHDELLKRPEAAQAEMGTGRDMGPGWINVSAESVRDDEQLAFWVETALDFNRTVTGQHN